jgi:hypothetical protein
MIIDLLTLRLKISRQCVYVPMANLYGDLVETSWHRPVRDLLARKTTGDERITLALDGAKCLRVGEEESELLIDLVSFR